MLVWSGYLDVGVAYFEIVLEHCFTNIEFQHAKLLNRGIVPLFLEVVSMRFASGCVGMVPKSRPSTSF